MASTHAPKQKPKRKKGSGRTTVLAGLLAVIALVALWLSDCIPGFGIGAGTKDGEGEAAEQAPKPEVQAEAPKPVEEPAVEAPVRKPMPMKVTVDARGCMVNGADPVDCKSVCEQAELFDNVDSVIIDAKDGPQGLVVELLDCVKAKDLAVKIIRE
jgi:hypothetical protein